MTPKRILILASILGNVLLILYYFKFQNVQAENKMNESVLQEQTAQIKHIKLENGKLKQEKQTAVLEAGRKAKKAMKEYYSAEIDDLKENHDIKVKDLHSYYRAKLKTVSEGSVAIGDTTFITKDSLVTTYPKISLDDGYLSLNGWFTKDKFNYNYTVTDSLSVAYSWEYKGIWPFKRRDHLNISFSSMNPNTRLSSVTSIVVEDKKKTRFKFGPYVGYGIDMKGNTGIQVGVGLSYQIF